MTSFAKYVAMFSAGFIAMSALPGKADDDKPSKPSPKETPVKKKKKPKTGETPAPKKGIDVPVERDHPAYGMFIPYFGNDGKRQMNFTIGVASRIDDNHMDLKDLKIETFDENEEHEMAIDLPTSIFNTATSVVTTRQHVTIRRDDWELTGECMIFNTRTKQGGLGGNVRMLIYNLENETSGNANAPGAKENAPVAKEK